MKLATQPVAVATALVFLAGGFVYAQGRGGADAAPVASPALGTVDASNFSWDDGLTHVVVYTDQAPPGLPQLSPVEGGVTAGSLGEAVRFTRTDPFRTPTPPDDTDGFERTVVELDGETSTRFFPAGSMVGVAPLDAERPLLDAIRDEYGAAVVVMDDDGVRYVGSESTLWVTGHLGPQRVPAPDRSEPEPTADPDSPDTAGVGEGSIVGADTVVADDTVAASIRALHQVRFVQQLAPGVLKVALGGDATVLETVPGVVSVGEDVMLGFADDPAQNLQWAIENTGNPDQSAGWPGTPDVDTNATDAWQVSEGQGVIVAVLDSGFEAGHPDFDDRVWRNTRENCGNGIDDDANGFVDDCTGWDFGFSDNDIAPDTAATVSYRTHGQHVAGIIGAGRNGVGVVGIAPKSTMMLLKVSRNNGISSGAVLAATRYAVDNGARVINMSLATGPNTPRSSVSALEDAVAYAHARGVIVVAGAGNNAMDTSNATVYPAAFSRFYDNVLSIGATTNTDTRAPFSNWGSDTGLWAPGYWIYSTIPGGYDWKSGTSMSTPMVAGGAALVIASGSATGAVAVRDRLVSTAVVTPVGPRLDVAAAIGAAISPSLDVEFSNVTSVPADIPSTIGVGISSTATITGAQVRLSVATLDGDYVSAVSGVPALFADAEGALQTSSSDTAGAFPPVAVRDTAALVAGGYGLDATVTLPAGRYALVTEVLDGSGGVVDGAFAGVFDVVAGAPGGPGAPGDTVPGVPLPENPIGGPSSTLPAPAPDDTVPAGDGSPGTPPGTSLPTPTTAPGSPGGGTLPGAPVTTTPATTAPGTVLPTVPTTAPARSGSTVPAPPLPTVPGAPTPTTPTPTTPSPTTPSTTPANGTAPATTILSGGSPAVPTTAPGGGSVTAPPTPTSPTAPTPTAPTPTTPTTTSTPRPDQVGGYVLESISPRIASTVGGDAASLTGRFPTTVPVYVWFGDAVVQARVNRAGTSLSVVVPPVSSARVVDVAVKFSTAVTFSLELADAFTYVAPTVSVPMTTVPSTTSTTQPRSGVTPTTQPAVPVTTVPSGGVTPTTQAAEQPRSGDGSVRPRRTEPLARGSVMLQPQPLSGAIAGLSTASFRSVCSSSPCPAVRLD